jgi:hypothetical protein
LATWYGDDLHNNQSINQTLKNKNKNKNNKQTNKKQTKNKQKTKTNKQKHGTGLRGARWEGDRVAGGELATRGLHLLHPKGCGRFVDVLRAKPMSYSKHARTQRVPGGGNLNVVYGEAHVAGVEVGQDLDEGLPRRLRNHVRPLGIHSRGRRLGEQLVKERTSRSNDGPMPVDDLNIR